MSQSWKSWTRALLGGAALLASAALARAEDTIKIGILHSLSGTMAISETILKDLMLMQIADLNAKGGLLGKKIEPVVVDPSFKLAAIRREGAQTCISHDQSQSPTFGCWTSVSRKSVLPVFEELNGLLVLSRWNTKARKIPTTCSTAVRCPTTKRSRPSNI